MYKSKCSRWPAARRCKRWKIEERLISAEERKRSVNVDIFRYVHLPVLHGAREALLVDNEAAGIMNSTHFADICCSLKPAY